MKIFSYVVAADFGFAPNPFHGVCSLGTCKPVIRKTVQIGDWIIGTGAKKNYNLEGRLIYAMKVEEILTFNQYWSEPRFFLKRPVLNGSIQQMYGDNIYRFDDGEWIQVDSHHRLPNGNPNPKNIRRDTQTDRVLISHHFVYFGVNAPVIPRLFREFGEDKEDICKKGPGHKYKFSEEIVSKFNDWLEDREEWGLQGLPWEFTSHLKDSNIEMEF